ncbi:hypothetical protein F8388_024813 [Cannabis sativa]|uniref:Neprosin PEP catalytic domain-containing protein n=1 Tax=Cannabis sativa TaxID=3483 RepID=A0A7J6DZI2_CANSA|nr:hypothetical protein F8388_024813 [Cannabis sativa]
MGDLSRKMRSLMAVICIWGLVSFSSSSFAARLNPSRQKLEVQKHLNRLNKPAVKSIESPDGDIIDCVHISHQPAFDHPFLKDHKIQTRPSYHPEGLFQDNKVSEKAKEKTNPMTQLWHVNGKCPEDTIPVRRTRKDDVLRASSVKRYGKKKHRSIPKPRSADPDLVNESGHQHAIAYVEGDKYFGAKATINVWEPKIQQPNEFSLSQLWILGGSFGEDLNSIEAGWQVSPDLYGDNNTRLFTYWTQLNGKVLRLGFSKMFLFFFAASTRTKRKPKNPQSFYPKLCLENSLTQNRTPKNPLTISLAETQQTRKSKVNYYFSNVYLVKAEAFVSFKVSAHKPHLSSRVRVLRFSLFSSTSSHSNGNNEMVLDFLLFSTYPKLHSKKNTKLLPFIFGSS